MTSLLFNFNVFLFNCKSVKLVKKLVVYRVETLFFFLVGSDSSSSDPSPTGTRTKPEPPERSVSVRTQQDFGTVGSLADTKSNSSSEDLHTSSQSR